MKKEETFQIFITSKFSFLSKLCLCHTWTCTTLDSDAYICQRDSSWSQTRGIGASDPRCHPLAGASGVSVPPTGVGGSPSHCAGCMSWKTPTAGSSVSERLSASGCSGIPGHSPCVWYQLQGGRSVCVSSKSCVWSVLQHPLTSTPVLCGEKSFHAH